MLLSPTATRPALTPDDIQRMLAMNAGAPPSAQAGMMGGRTSGTPSPGILSTVAQLATAPTRSLAMGMSGTGASNPQAPAPMGGMFGNTKDRAPPTSVGVGPPSSPDPANLFAQADAMPTPGTDVMSLPVNLSGIPNRKPKFFEHHGLGEQLLKGVGEFALQYSAGMGNPAAMAMLQNRSMQQRQQQAWDHEDATHRQDHQWDVDAAAAKARLPEYFMSGRDRVAYDPVTGTSKVVYDGPSDAQDYADSLGYKPGTPQYQTAVSDYVLRGNGATAFQNKTTFEGVRQDNREATKSIRQRNRVDLRGMPTYANLHPRTSGGGGGGGSAPPRTLAGVVAPIVAKLAHGEPLTPAEQGVYNDYKTRGHGGGRSAGLGGPAPAAGGVPEGTMIRNAQGHTLRRQNGAWVEVR